MPIPDPPKMPHKLIACPNRFSYQMRRATNYLKLISSSLHSEEQNPQETLEFCFETLVVMLHTFLEEFYKSMISIATFWYPAEVRTFMMARLPSESLTYEAMPASVLSANVTQRFSFNSKKMENFKALFKRTFRNRAFL